MLDLDSDSGFAEDSQSWITFGGNYYLTPESHAAKVTVDLVWGLDDAVGGTGSFGNLGIGMAASAAAAINHVLDAREDAKMTRTHNRPLPQGEINGRNALLFALLLGALSMVILVV